jgi:hypothetical protein
MMAKAKRVVVLRGRIRPASVTLDELHEQAWLLYDEISAATAKRPSTVSNIIRVRAANVAAGRRTSAPQPKY